MSLQRSSSPSLDSSYNETPTSARSCASDLPKASRSQHNARPVSQSRSTRRRGGRRVRRSRRERHAAPTGLSCNDCSPTSPKQRVRLRHRAQGRPPGPQPRRRRRDQPGAQQGRRRAAGLAVTENIDETPSGMLLHGIMSSIAEFYSRNLANEVIKGSYAEGQERRHRRQGTDRLPQRQAQGRERPRDPHRRDRSQDRGPLMRWAFERYATGEWTVRRPARRSHREGADLDGRPQDTEQATVVVELQPTA